MRPGSLQVALLWPPHQSQLAPWAPWFLRELTLDPVATCWGLWLGGFVLPRGSLRSFWNSPRTGNFHPSPQGRSRQDRPRAGEGAGRGEDPVGCRPSRAGCPGPTTQPWAQLHTLGQGSVWAPNSTRPCAGSPQNGGVGPLLPQAYTWVPPKAFMDGGPGLWGSGPPSRTQITGWVASTLGLQGLAWTSAVSTWDPSCHHCGSTIFAKVAAAGPCPRRHFLAPHSIMGRLRLRASLRGKKQGSQPTAQPCAPVGVQVPGLGDGGQLRGLGRGQRREGWLWFHHVPLLGSCCFRGQAGRGAGLPPQRLQDRPCPGCGAGRERLEGQPGWGRGPLGSGCAALAQALMPSWSVTHPEGCRGHGCAGVLGPGRAVSRLCL